VIHRRPRSSHYFLSLRFPRIILCVCDVHYYRVPTHNSVMCIVTTIITSVGRGGPVAVVSAACGARERSEKWLTTIRSLAAAAARALPPSRSPSPQCPPRTLRSADLPGASYFAPQGRRHISHEARSRIILLWSCTPSSRTRLARACRLENSRAIGPTVISRRHPRLGRDDDTAGRYIAPCVS